MYCHHGNDKKKNSLDLRKIIVNAHKRGEAYTHLSKHFQMSRPAMRSIIEKYYQATQWRTTVGSERFQKLCNENY